MWWSRWTLTDRNSGTSYAGGTGSSAAASCSLKTSSGRASIVPWIRIPAVSVHHRRAACCASSSESKFSPAKKLPRTYCTTRSTFGLSCGERTLAGSVTNPACWE